MGITEWLQAYYPIPASEATGSNLEAAEHSLRKWEGALDKVLENYDLEYEDHMIRDPKKGKDFRFGSEECALCLRHDRNISSKAKPGPYDRCTNCPLPDADGGRTCFDNGSAYNRGPEAMVEALTQVILNLK